MRLIKYSGLHYFARPVDVASPLLLNLVLFSYFVVMPFFLVDKRHEYYLALFVAVVGFISINIGLLIKVVQGAGEAPTPDFSWRRSAEVFVALFVVYDILRIFSFLVDGVSQAAYHEDYGKSRGWGLYVLLVWVALGFCKYYFYSIVLAGGKRMFWGLFAISLLATIAGRVRFELVGVVIFFVIYGTLNGYLKLRLYHLVVGVVFAPALMLLLLIKRDIVGDVDFFRVWHLVVDRLVSLWRDSDLIRELLVSMEAPATFEIFNRVVQDDFVRPESGVIRVFFNFIPREIWPDKPLPMQIELARVYNPSGFASGGGVFANIYGDAYANAGFVGVVLLPFLVGLLLNLAYKKAVVRSSGAGVSIGFYAVLVVYFANFYRGYFSDLTWQIILLYCVFWFLNKINYKLNQIKERRDVRSEVSVVN